MKKFFVKIYQTLRKLFLIILALVAIRFIASLVLAHKGVGTNAESTSTSKAEVEKSVSQLSTHNGESYWVNTEDKIGALFPSEPQRLTATNSETKAYAYQAAEITDHWRALYSITVSPLTKGTYVDNSNTEIHSLSHRMFVASMGADEEKNYTYLEKFSDGRPTLHYELHYTHESEPVKAIGFWLLDTTRTLRVSVACVYDCESPEATERFNLFLDSFTTIKEGE
jgi:hypothetical protein